MIRVYTFVVKDVVDTNGVHSFEASCSDFPGLVARSTSFNALVAEDIVSSVYDYWLDSETPYIKELPAATPFDVVAMCNTGERIVTVTMDDRDVNDSVVFDFVKGSPRVKKWIIKALYRRFIDSDSKNFGSYLLDMYYNGKHKLASGN